MSDGEMQMDSNDETKNTPTTGPFTALLALWEEHRVPLVIVGLLLIFAIIVWCKARKEGMGASIPKRGFYYY